MSGSLEGIDYMCLDHTECSSEMLFEPSQVQGRLLVMRLQQQKSYPKLIKKKEIMGVITGIWAESTHQAFF